MKGEVMVAGNKEDRSVMLILHQTNYRVLEPICLTAVHDHVFHHAGTSLSV